MLEQAFAAMVDADGNFVEQLQTSGFDSRIWELYLSQYFGSAGFDVERLERPDFLVEREGLEIAVEATTSNPTQPQAIEPDLETEDGLRWVIEQYLPVKYGSSLYSKLRDRHWEEDAVQGRPFVLAIQSFAFEGSLSFSLSSLGLYLYGRRPEWFHDENEQVASIMPAFPRDPLKHAHNAAPVSGRKGVGMGSAPAGVPPAQAGLLHDAHPDSSVCFGRDGRPGFTLPLHDARRGRSR